MDWNNLKVNIVGEKGSTAHTNFCPTCDLPVKVYGRMIPCKHAFCHPCAVSHKPKCGQCNEGVARIERCLQNQVFVCCFGGANNCGRTYLSQRDLDAHINHRHKVKTETEAIPQHKRSNLITIPLQKNTK